MLSPDDRISIVACDQSASVHLPEFHFHLQVELTITIKPGAALPSQLDDGIGSTLVSIDWGTARQIFMRVRAIHQPRRPPSALASILQLFLFTHYAHQLSRICKLLPTIETADVVQAGAGALGPSRVPVNAVKQIR